MRNMVMHMSGSNGVLSVPDEHLPGLIVLVFIGPALWLALAGLRALTERHVGWAGRLTHRIDALSFAAKAVLVATLVGALVHAVIVPTHWGDTRTTAILFIADTVGLAVAFAWTLLSRPHWRLVAAAMLGGTACAYALYILTGWESMDLVGLLTTTIEAAAALVLLAPSTVPTRQRNLAAAAVPVALLSLLGTSVIASASPAGPATSTPPATSGSSSIASPAMSMPGSTDASTAALSLPTTSAAGPIVWPDNMAAMAAGMQMAEPNCTAQPTAAQQQAAVQLVDQTVAATSKYTSLAAAKAAGYVAVTTSGKRIVHYINPAFYRQGNALDPNAVPALVYVNTSHGAVLSAAMYLDPKGMTPPQPGGCLTQWHIHTDLCFGSGGVVGNNASVTCPAGSVNKVTQPMMHVWLAPVTGGPLTPDPPPLSEFEAANQLPTLSTPNGTA
jgi:hypothetical protein